MVVAASGATDGALAWGLLRLLRLKRAFALMVSMEKNVGHDWAPKHLPLHVI